MKKVSLCVLGAFMMAHTEGGADQGELRGRAFFRWIEFEVDIQARSARLASTQRPISAASHHA
jgi:hypothetical protein